MSYRLTFLESAYKEWKKLPPDARQQFTKKLEERLKQPQIPSAALREMERCYKIKLRKLGYRLVYRVHDDRLVVQVIAIGKRDKSEVYQTAQKRIH